MNDIILYVNKDKILRLKYFDGIHPALVSIKADHWKLIYQLYNSDNLLIDSGLFTSKYLLDEQKQILIIEEYDESILNKEAIKRDENVKLNLRLFDFHNNKTGKFSKVTGGSFILQKLINNTLIFSKHYFYKTIEHEIDLTKIKFENLLTA